MGGQTSGPIVCQRLQTQVSILNLTCSILDFTFFLNQDVIYLIFFHSILMHEKRYLTNSFDSLIAFKLISG